jgi:hypothetical protein
LSLWLTDENSAGSSGILVELDHWNETTKVKDTTMKYCDQMPEGGQEANCRIVDFKVKIHFILSSLSIHE